MEMTQEMAQQIFDTISIESLSVSDKNPAINMLNTKYIIVNPGTKAIRNTNANGPAWFVQSVKWVSSANEELSSLTNCNTKKQAIVHQEFKTIASGTNMDTTASIRMVKYGTTELRYKSASKADQIAVFSEIYYPEGWNCYVDGKQIETFRANYVLRAAKIKKGEHQIEEQIEVANKIIQFLKTELKDNNFDSDLIECEGEILKAVFTKIDAHFTNLDLHLKEITPYTRLSFSELFTGGSNLNLSLEI